MRLPIVAKETRPSFSHNKLVPMSSVCFCSRKIPIQCGVRVVWNAQKLQWRPSSLVPLGQRGTRGDHCTDPSWGLTAQPSCSANWVMSAQDAMTWCAYHSLFCVPCSVFCSAGVRPLPKSHPHPAWKVCSLWPPRVTKSVNSLMMQSK
jgi:hypothetical protein